MTDGTKLTKIPPQHLQDFSYTRTTHSGANRLEITLYDQTAIDLESYLIEQDTNHLEFSYGWYNGKESPIYLCLIADYELQLDAQGAVLSITGTSESVIEHGKNRKYAWTLNGEPMGVSEIVEEIASLNGWDVGIIEPTESVYVNDDDLKLFEQNNISDTKFIKNELISYAKTEEKGIGGYQLWFRDLSDGIEVNFSPPRYKKEPSDTYVYEYKSRESRVFSFDSQYSGFIMMNNGGSRVVSRAYDTESNDFIKSVTTYNTNSEKELAEKKIKLGMGQEVQTNDSSLSINEAENKTNSIFSFNNEMMYRANMSVDGNPILQPFAVITVLVFVNKGELHHTSGTYLVVEITDSISGGVLTSDLTLMRNSSKVGDENAVGEKAGG